MNRALYVKLDQETWDRLRELSEEERREMSAQAAVLIREALRDKAAVAAR